MQIEKITELIEGYCGKEVLIDALDAMMNTAVGHLSSERQWHEDHDRWGDADDLTEKIEFLLKVWEELGNG